jgi:serine protease Do
MKQINWKVWRSAVLGAAMAGGLALSFAPLAPVFAQARALPDFTDLVEQVGPSVVNIRTVEKVAQRQGDDEMAELFRRFGLPNPNGPRQNRPQQAPQGEEELQRGVGSGFILTADGYVMTNAHVVDGADEVMVTLTDKREFKAKLIGLDKRSDVAVVKIEASGLPAVKVGDVNRMKVGEWVIAIGSPFGLENSVTAGIVSAKARDTGELLPLIQTDVAINPGNSGGPLLNMRGEVVGINSQIYSRSGGYMGISFAIPIDEAIRVSEQLRANGRVARGRIGVELAPVTKDVAESIGLGKPLGALVRSVEAGFAADKAGIEAGDIITKFGGKAIEKLADLARSVSATPPGSKAAVTVFRGGAYKDLNVVVGEAEADAKPTRLGQGKDDGGKGGKASKAAQALGLTVSELSEAQKKKLNLKGGVRVDAATDVAARAGLREDDVILRIANTAINNLKDFEAAAAKLDRSKAVSVLYRRDQWSQYAVIPPAK